MFSMFLSIFLLTMSSPSHGHLLIVAAIRGSRAAVRGPERREAEPHSMAFSCKEHTYDTVGFNLVLWQENRLEEVKLYVNLFNIVLIDCNSKQKTSRHII